jgi:uncharacterized protein (TIGR02147 family)
MEKAHFNRANPGLLVYPLRGEQALSNIYAYLDFREYLKDYQEKRQAKDKKFTKAQLCRLLGLPNTRSYFVNVLKDKEVSREFVERFILALSLNGDEAQYFRVLVQFNQCRNGKEREFLLDQLISLNKSPKALIPLSAYRFYREWYHSAIRALLDVIDVADDTVELTRRLHPQISAGKISDSLNLLRELDFIRMDAKGFWKPTDKCISVGSYVQDQLVKQYQLQCFELGNSALLESSRGKKNFSTVTMSMSKETRDKIEKKIQLLKSQIGALVNGDEHKADCVYQLNMQFFPQSQDMP